MSSPSPSRSAVPDPWFSTLNALETAPDPVERSGLLLTLDGLLLARRHIGYSDAQLQASTEQFMTVLVADEASFNRWLAARCLSRLPISDADARECFEAVCHDVKCLHTRMYAPCQSMAPADPFPLSQTTVVPVSRFLSPPHRTSGACTSPAEKSASLHDLYRALQALSTFFRIQTSPLIDWLDPAMREFCGRPDADPLVVTFVLALYGGETMPRQYSTLSRASKWFHIVYQLVQQPEVRSVPTLALRVSSFLTHVFLPSCHRFCCAAYRPSLPNGGSIQQTLSSGTVPLRICCKGMPSCACRG